MLNVETNIPEDDDDKVWMRESLNRLEFDLKDYEETLIRVNREMEEYAEGLRNDAEKFSTEANCSNSEEGGE